jgi:hypothetical protein
MLRAAPAIVRNNISASNERAGIGLDDYRKRGLLRGIVVNSTVLNTHRDYDRQHRDSLTTTVGAFASDALSTSIGGFVPQFTADWVHEFQDDQRAIYFRCREDLRPDQAPLPRPTHRTATTPTWAPAWSWPSRRACRSS